MSIEIEIISELNDCRAVIRALIERSNYVDEAIKKFAVPFIGNAEAPEIIGTIKVVEKLIEQVIKPLQEQVEELQNLQRDRPS